MAWADFAVASASVTTLEMACLGLPALVMLVADNQRQIAQYLDDRENSPPKSGSLGSGTESCFVCVPRLLALAGDSEERARMSAPGQALVDGAGARRGGEAMNEAASMRIIVLGNNRVALETLRWLKGQDVEIVGAGHSSPRKSAVWPTNSSPSPGSPASRVIEAPRLRDPECLRQIRELAAGLSDYPGISVIFSSPSSWNFSPTV